MVDVNLNGAFLCAQGAYALMKRQRPQGGRIINNGSISAHAPRPMSAPYTATKHAISGLTKSIALDGRAFDIACGQIDVGNAETEMTERMAEGVPQADGRIAVEPRIDAGEVGAAIVHMASLPLSSNVLSMTLMATKMPFVGRGEARVARRTLGEAFGGAPRGSESGCATTGARRSAARTGAAACRGRGRARTA